MAWTRAVVGLTALVIVASVPALVQGQKAGKPTPTTQPTEIPLRVTFAGLDDFGNPTALRGHPGIGDVAGHAAARVPHMLGAGLKRPPRR